MLFNLQIIEHPQVMVSHIKFFIEVITKGILCEVINCIFTHYFIIWEK